MRKLIIRLGFGPNGFYDDLTSSVRFHRILRRGREYGSELLPKEALQPAPPDESPRGLHFICLNANISRQFEFLQNAWIASTKFAGLTRESDRLLGNRESIPGCSITGSFTMPGDGSLRRRLSEMPQFVTVRGGAYFSCQVYAPYGTLPEQESIELLHQPHFLSTREQSGNGNQDHTHGTQLSNEGQGETAQIFEDATPQELKSLYPNFLTGRH